jgi:hypothetical protein
MYSLGGDDGGGLDYGEVNMAGNRRMIIPEKEKKKKFLEGLGSGQPLLFVCLSVGENRFHILRPGKLLFRAL